MDGNELTDAGVVALVGTPALAALRHLDLGDAELTERAVVALTRARFAPFLHTLRLSCACLEDTGLTRLLRADPFSSLTDLDLMTNRLTVRHLMPGGRSPLTAHSNVQDCVPVAVGNRVQTEARRLTRTSPEVGEGFKLRADTL